MINPVKVIVVGMGARAMIYAGEALSHPELFTIAGIVDINQEGTCGAAAFHVPDSHCFRTVEELTAVPKFADAVINCTMDRLHVATTIPLLKKGYDVLLEKPFAVNQQEADALLRCADETKRTVMICHVLRYAPFTGKSGRYWEAVKLGGSLISR